MLEQLGDPLRVLHIRLAAGHRLHVRRVQQPGLEPVLQAVEHRLPIRRGRLHPGQRHPALDQPVGHELQRPGHRGERPRLRAPPAIGSRRAHAHRHRRLPDIQTGDPVEQHIHQQLPSARRPCNGVARRALYRGHRPTCSKATIRHTREPHAKLFCGLNHTRVRRRRRATPHSHPPAQRLEESQPITPLAPSEGTGPEVTAQAACTPFGWV